MNKYFRNKKIKIVFGVLRDKDYIKMIDELIKVSDEFITVTPENSRALKAEELKEIIEERGKRAKAFLNIKEAVEYAINNLDYDVLVFVVLSI
ncbi:hypothetical protein PL321_12655 [Caloramator sp. mosi_1]|uniref:glutamate ligase domain-containing protein n=1 Tax=Caloramator sp. mosi_1 TaxID=3023090 RepID=UPI00235F2713|nr:hypothetical protein [Caloramator sp. mosi_1]WDC83541.1 hypothetical protein PL321_12655 [Caloramator sp. mosi_1]